MTIKKVEMRPKLPDGTYGDIVYPKTSADMVEGLSATIANETSGNAKEATSQSILTSSQAIGENVDTLVTRLGTNASTASSSTSANAHAKLNSLLASMSTINTNTSTANLGSPTSTASSSTSAVAHAKLNYILSQLGNSTISSMPYRKQLFTSSGTFNVPTGVNLVYVTMVGGGGGGGAGGPSWNSGSYYRPGGGGGAGGSSPITVRLPVYIPEGTTSVSVTVGQGGAGANSIAPTTTPQYYGGGNGGAGTPSKFGTRYTSGIGSGGVTGMGGRSDGYESHGGGVGVPISATFGSSSAITSPFSEVNAFGLLTQYGASVGPVYSSQGGFQSEGSTGGRGGYVNENFAYSALLEILLATSVNTSPSVSKIYGRGGDGGTGASSGGGYSGAGSSGSPGFVLVEWGVL